VVPWNGAAVGTVVLAALVPAMASTAETGTGSDCPVVGDHNRFNGGLTALKALSKG
jgi:hypothetical protein